METRRIVFLLCALDTMTPRSENFQTLKESHIATKNERRIMALVDDDLVVVMLLYTQYTVQKPKLFVDSTLINAVLLHALSWTYSHFALK